MRSLANEETSTTPTSKEDVQFNEFSSSEKNGQYTSHKYEEEDDDEEETVNENEEDTDEDEEPGLAVDMYESDNELLLQCMIAGVTPENLQISITRDAVSIKGRRVAPQGIPEENYLLRELYWGTFSRIIELPYEVDTDGAEAVEKYGLLIIRLPKMDTRRTQELKVKSI